jgi:thiol-disulfide isomerase/thioredoxin
MTSMRSALVRMALSGLFFTGFSVSSRADDTKSKDPNRIELSELQQFYDSIQADLEAGRRPDAADEFMSLLFSTRAQPVPNWYGPCRSRYDWAWVSARYDANRDGQVGRKEFSGSEPTWSLLDHDGDGVLTGEDFDWENSAWARQENLVQQRFRSIDADNDGRVTAEEWAKVFSSAAGSNGALSVDDFRRTLLNAQTPQQGQNLDRRPMTAKRRADYIRAILREDAGTISEGPQVGELAPEFTLKTQDGKGPISLSSFRGSRPVVITMGCYTCPPYRARVPGIDKLRELYGNKVEFLGIYVREAHPTDGWVLDGNTKAGINEPQPTNQTQRLAVAQKYCDTVKPNYPLLVDEMDDRVTRAYSGTPNRLYIVDRDGRVVYKSGRGPRGYRTEQLEQSLALLLLDQETTSTHVAAGAGVKAAK